MNIHNSAARRRWRRLWPAGAMMLLVLCRSVEPAYARIDIEIAPLITGLSEPVDIVDPGDASGRLFIVERPGRIRVWDGVSLFERPFLDVSHQTTTDAERGLLGMAFHPDYSMNGRFFIHYTDLDGNTVLASYNVSDDPEIAAADSASVLMRVQQPFANHNGGQIRFGPDGFLYIAIGDGGSGNDPMNNGQDLNTLLGKILRIDVDGGMPYAIPQTNPFAGRPDARGEIWAYGLRNPWRFSFDRLTGDLWIADVGQNRFEEVNFQPVSSTGGENYGWRLMEGLTCFNPPTSCNGNNGLVWPVLAYDRDTGSSVTGGYVYRGARFPALEGRYLFADFIAGRILVAEAATPQTWEIISAAETGLRISAFGQDADGEILLAHFNTTDGAVYEIRVATDTSPPLGPASASNGSGGGCFIQSFLF